MQARRPKTNPKLTVSRQTLRKLTSGQLSMVVGGSWDHPTQCPNDSCPYSCPLTTGGRHVME